MAKKRTNVIPIIEDARHPAKYRMLVGMVDVIFSDVAQPDQVLFVLLYDFIATLKFGLSTIHNAQVHLCSFSIFSMFLI